MKDQTVASIEMPIEIAIYAAQLGTDIQRCGPPKSIEAITAHHCLKLRIVFLTLSNESWTIINRLRMYVGD